MSDNERAYYAWMAFGWPPSQTTSNPEAEKLLAWFQRQYPERYERFQTLRGQGK